MANAIYLFLALSKQAFSESEEFILMSSGLENGVIGDEAELAVDPGELDYATCFLCAAESHSAGEAVVRRAWEERGNKEVLLELLAKDPRELTSFARQLAAEVDAAAREAAKAAAARLGGVVAFKRGSVEGCEAAKNVVRMAVLRKWWQFWR